MSWRASGFRMPASTAKRSRSSPDRRGRPSRHRPSAGAPPPRRRARAGRGRPAARPVAARPGLRLGREGARVMSAREDTPSRPDRRHRRSGRHRLRHSADARCRGCPAAPLPLCPIRWLPARRLRISHCNRCRRGVEPQHESEVPAMPSFLRSRAAGAVLTAAIVGLTLATAYIHLDPRWPALHPQRPRLHRPGRARS